MITNTTTNITLLIETVIFCFLHIRIL